MPPLKATKPQQNLQDGFAGESQANRRHLDYFETAGDPASRRIGSFPGNSGEMVPYERFEENWNAIGGQHGRKD